jgi:hypothetical protein
MLDGRYERVDILDRKRFEAREATGERGKVAEGTGRSSEFLVLSFELWCLA